MMKRQANVWAGTALALLMTSAQAPASPAGVRPAPQPATTPSLMLVQDQPSEEELLRKRQEEEQQQQQQEAPAEQAPPEPQPAPEPEPAPQSEEAPQPQAEPEQSAPEAPAEQQPAEEAPAEAAPAPAEPEQPQAPEQQQEAPAPQPEQAPEAPAEQAPAETPPAPEAPAAETPPTPAPAPDQPTPPETQAPAEAPAQPTPDQQAPTPDERPAAPADQAPATPETPPAPAEQAPQPAQPESAPAEQPAAPDAGQAGEAMPENAAPVLDSQKEPRRERRQSGQQDGQQQQPAEQAAQPPAEPAGPPPADDRAAQESVAPVEVAPVTAEEGRRVERAPDIRRQERPRGADVLREIGDRVIIQFNDQTIVESNDRPRMSRGARDVYYEDLPRGRTRETIVRENGVQVVTIRNRYGDVVRRSRIMPDGREYILSYVDDNAYEERGGWRDPGDDLPPMRLTIPVDEYILDAERADDVDAYYDFLDQPPVERVERLYSVDEVKRSARVRDKTRRVDLDTITFDFGKASIAESEVSRLDGVAQAMERLLKQNPAETFLIEGHTDAVGTELANLALSDRRAEAVADALTDVFGIPPENLTTQGYGEQYLKVRTQEPERENRRVAIRRITALVAPVASAN
jgi:outer membrane protein OmpA-like peptidoglycan-associated protein